MHVRLLLHSLLENNKNQYLPPPPPPPSAGPHVDRIITSKHTTGAHQHPSLLPSSRAQQTMMQANPCINNNVRAESMACELSGGLGGRLGGRLGGHLGGRLSGRRG